MQIDEAIKLIQEDINDTSVDWATPLGEAYKMSFEALKRVKTSRDPHGIPPYIPLLGETEE